MVGIMNETAGHAGQPGYTVHKGERVYVTPATNIPPRDGLDYFVESIDNPRGEILVSKSEVTILEG